MSDPCAPAVELIDVHKHFDRGAVRALDGLTLAIERGEWVAVTGPSGCGKSTMLHLVAALDRPTSGIVRVGGIDVARLHHAAGYRRHQVGLVFQLHHLVPQLTAAENVEIAMFGSRRSRRERHRRARSLLADVDLAGREDRQPTRLSGGERQRVAIARALANEPSLLLADEPTGGLDGDSIDRVLGLFRALRTGRPELTVVVVTHDPTVAMAADRVVRLRAGRVDEAAPAMAGQGL